MIKAYMCVNQFNDLKHLYTLPELTLRIRDNAKACRSYQQLDEKIVELQFDLKKEDIKETPKDTPFDEYEPGFYNTGPGWYYFKGDPTLIKEIRTVVQSNIDDPKIPRTSIIAVVEDPKILQGDYWWNNKALVGLIDRFKPKWMCKGYLREIIGTDKVRIDYVPVSIDDRVLTQVVKDIFEGLSRASDNLESVFLDHGTNQEVDLLDL